MLGDYVLPDHTALESWGYHARWPAPTAPAYPARSRWSCRCTTPRLHALDVLALGGPGCPTATRWTSSRTSWPPCSTRAADTVDRPGDRHVLGALPADRRLVDAQQDLPSAAAPDRPGSARRPQVGRCSARGEFHLVTFPTQPGRGSGANRPWLQETPDPSTTVTWNTWVEINPETAEELGLRR